MAVTFDPPLPGLNASHLQGIVITGTVDGESPNCNVTGLINQHGVLIAFAVAIGGDFTLTITAGQLQDDNLYLVSIWSDDTGSQGSIFIDTRPVG